MSMFRAAIVIMAVVVIEMLFIRMMLRQIRRVVIVINVNGTLTKRLMMASVSFSLI